MRTRPAALLVLGLALIVAGPRQRERDASGTSAATDGLVAVNGAVPVAGRPHAGRLAQAPGGHPSPGTRPGRDPARDLHRLRPAPSPPASPPTSAPDSRAPARRPRRDGRRPRGRASRTWMTPTPRSSAARRGSRSATRSRPSGSSASASSPWTAGSAAASAAPPFDADVAIIDSGISKTHPGRPARRRQGLHPQRQLGRRLRPRHRGREHPGRPRRPPGHRGHPARRSAVVGAHLRQARAGPSCRGCCAALTGWPVGATATTPSAVLRGRDPVLLHRGREHASPCRTATAAAAHSTSSTRPICRIERQGTILVAAAGNYGQKAARRRSLPATAGHHGLRDGRLRWSSPAARAASPRRARAGAAPERDDRFASFSSYGQGVDLIAPGKCIWVAYRGKSYARVSGTSFATPMVLGAALLYRKRYPHGTAQPGPPWRSSTPADATGARARTPIQRHEPQVDVRHFAPAADLRLLPTRHAGPSGATAIVHSSALHAHRLHGHTARITLQRHARAEGASG